MISYFEPPSPLPGALLLACLAVLAGFAPPVVATQFTPPDLAGFELQEQHDADGDGDGKNETHIMHYLNQNGDSVFSMTTKGRIWAWSLDTSDDDTGGPNNYVIRDSDCDGVFDEAYSLEDEFHVPDCLE
jgi:hypothetical protein